MIVNNTTTVDGKMAQKILFRTEKRSLMSQFVLGPLIIIAGIAVIIIGALSSETVNIIFGSVFAAIGIAYIVYAFISLKKAPKKIAEKNKDIVENGVTYTYKFKEQSIGVVIKEIHKTTKAEYKYTDMKKRVYDYDDSYELMSKEGMLMIVDKAGFENERMEEFFLKNLSINKRKIVNKHTK